MKHDADHWWTCECDGCRGISYPSVPAVEPPHTVTIASDGRDVTEASRFWRVLSGGAPTTTWDTEAAALQMAKLIRDIGVTHVEVRVTVECKVTEIP